MTDDLEDRLSALFDRVAGTVTVAEELDRVRSIDPRRRRTWLPAVAAAVVVLAGVGAIVSITVGDDPDRSVSQQPARTSGGRCTSFPRASMDRRWAMGRWGPHGSSRTAGSSWRRRTVTGSSTRSRSRSAPCPRSDTEPSLPPDEEFSFPVVASEPREDLRLSAVVNLPWVQRALGSVEVADDGSLTLTAGSPLTVLETFDSPEPYELHTTYPEVTSERNDLVVVETVNRGCAAGHPHRGWRHRLERDTVQGVDAWHLSRTDADGEWHGLAWLHAPFQVVYVTGHARSTRSARSPRASMWSTRRHGSRRPDATADPSFGLGHGCRGGLWAPRSVLARASDFGVTRAGIALDVSEHAAAVPGRKGAFEP